MGSKRIDRLGDLVRHGLVARFTCPNANCGRSALHHPADLIGFLGRDKPLGQVRGRCSTCGAKILGVRPAGVPWARPAKPPPLPVATELRPPRARREREAPERETTLAELRKVTSWVWWYCEAYPPGQVRPCGYSGGLALMPYILAWGPDTPRKRLQDSLACPLCHAPGGAIRAPSMEGSHGPQPFPAGCVATPKLIAAARTLSR